MTYLDYLPDTPYAALPAAVQAEISAAEYAQLQVLGAGLAEPAGLPNALGLALAAKVAPTPIAASAVAKTTGVHAGWRLAAVLSTASFVGVLAYSLFSSPYGKTNSTAVAPLPKTDLIERVVIQRDTIERLVRDTVTLFQTKVEVREVRDTVYLKRDVPIADVDPLNSDESKDASKSLSSGLNWTELTVRGGGELGGRE